MPPSVVVPGVPMAASHALDRLARPEISSSTVTFAVRALPRHHGARLRAVVEAADEVFLAKTLPNLRGDPARPWWWRRRGC